MRRLTVSLLAAGFLVACSRAPTSPTGVPLSASRSEHGSAPALAWSQGTNLKLSSYPWGTVDIGQDSTVTFTLTNTGGRSSGTVTIDPLSSSVYSITADGCAGSGLGPNKSCTVTVEFTPTGSGTFTATLTAGAEHGSASLDLTGKGGSGITLTLAKRVVNDDGGSKVVGDFGLSTTAGALAFGAGVADGASTLRYTSDTLSVSAGTYSLHENTVAGYTDGTWSCTKGLVSGNAQTGSVTLAAADSVTCIITNNDNPVATISMSPTSPTVAVGAQTALTATPRDAAGSPLPYPVTWTALDPAYVTVSSTGVVTGAAVGTGRVVATAEAVADTVTVTVVQQ